MVLCIEMGINFNEICREFFLYYSLFLEYRGLGRIGFYFEIVGKGGRSLIKRRFEI